MKFKNFCFEGVLDFIFDDSIKKEQTETKIEGLKGTEMYRNVKDNMIAYSMDFDVVHFKKTEVKKFTFFLSDYLIFFLMNHICRSFEKYIPDNGVLETKTVDGKSFVLIINFKNYKFKTIYFYVKYENSAENRFQMTDTKMNVENYIKNINDKFSEIESISCKIDKLFDKINSKI